MHEYEARHCLGWFPSVLGIMDQPFELPGTALFPINEVVLFIDYGVDWLGTALDGKSPKYTLALKLVHVETKYAMISSRVY